MGEVASLTGGLPSSWAVSAASQAQNDYNQQLSDVIPALYDAAYNRYLNEDSLKRNDLGLLMDVDNTYYNRYRDTVSDSQWQQTFDYGVERDGVADSQWQQTFDHNKGMDEWTVQNTEKMQIYEQAMSKWQMTGVADEEIAKTLGVPVGATTESYYFNKASMELQQAKQQEANAEKDAAAAEQQYAEDAIVTAISEYLDNAPTPAGGSKEEAACAIIWAKGVTSATEFYRIGRKAGIPDDVLKTEFAALYNQAVNELNAGGGQVKDYLYYAGLMGAAGGEAEQIAWLEANKYALPQGMYEELLKLVGMD